VFVRDRKVLGIAGGVIGEPVRVRDQGHASILCSIAPAAPAGAVRTPVNACRV
jgi:hypothetical protein